MWIRWIVENLVFQWMGVSLLIAVIMFMLPIVGVYLPERVIRIAAGIAAVPVLFFFVLLSAALVGRGIGD